MTTKDSGIYPVFPSADVDGGLAFGGERYERGKDLNGATTLTVTYPGMTLRDYFAAKALEIFDINDMQERGTLGVAKIAYEMADAMLEARK